MGLRRLFDFYAGLGDYVRPDEGVSGGRYHYVIVTSGVACGLVLGLVGGGVIFGLWPEGKPFPPKFLLAPAVFFVMGVIFGVATACTLAPSRFLRGPAGRKWMGLIGTDRPIVARLVCAAFTLLFLAFVALMAWAAWSDMQRGPLR